MEIKELWEMRLSSLPLLPDHGRELVHNWKGYLKKKSNKLPQSVNISHGSLNFLPPSHFKMSYLHPHAHGFRSESLRSALIETCTIQLQPAHETPVFMEKKTKNHIRQQIPLNSCMIWVMATSRRSREWTWKTSHVHRISFPRHSILVSRNQIKDFLNWRMHLNHCLTPRASLNLTNPFLNPFILFTMPQYPVARSSTP